MRKAIWLCTGVAVLSSTISLTASLSKTSAFTDVLETLISRMWVAFGGKRGGGECSLVMNRDQCLGEFHFVPQYLS